MVAILTLVVVAWTAWTAWTAWQVNSELSAAVDDAQRLQTAVSDDDRAATDAALDDLRAHSEAAADHTSGLAWSIAAHLPFVGDDAEGVRVVSSVLADLSRSGLEPLVETSRHLDDLVPQDSRISLEAVSALGVSVADGDEAFASAERQLASQDPSGYVGVLREKYVDLADQVSDAADTLASADTALQVLPEMLGKDGPRDYLMVFQNNAEIRATGGLPGAVSLVHADNGRIGLTRQVAANSFGETERPVLPLTPAEQAIYRDQLGTYFLDANFTPDFPRASALMKARWEQEYDEEIDGVVALDPVALSYVLAAVGPVQVGDLALTSDNVVDQLLHQTYLDIADPDAQDTFFQLVAKTIFDRVTTGGGSGTELVRALAHGTDEGRILVSSLDPAEEEVLSGHRIAGELLTDPSSTPEVGVYLNDATGAKMSYYLRFDARVEAISCQSGVQVLRGVLTLRSEAPDDAASLPDYVTGGGAFGIPEGGQIVLVRLYGPVEGTLSGVKLGKRPLDHDVVDQDGRPVATLNVYLTPGSTQELSFAMTTGAGQEGDVRVAVTPSVEVGDSSSIAASAC